MLTVTIVKTDFLNPSMKLPEYATPRSGGLDVQANISSPIKIEAGMTYPIPLGFKVCPQQPNIHGLLLPRSGKGIKGLVLANLIGLIDNDFQGEVTAVVWNRNRYGSVTIQPGETIAQLAFVELPQVTFEIKESFDEETERGEGGFGSTDKEPT